MRLRKDGTLRPTFWMWTVGNSVGSWIFFILLFIALSDVSRLLMIWWHWTSALAYWTLTIGFVLTFWRTARRLAVEDAIAQAEWLSVNPPGEVDEEVQKEDKTDHA